MLDPIISGIGLGLILTMLLGPVFFTLLQTALHEGFKAGAHLAFGVLFSDLFWILVCYTFASNLDIRGEYKIVVAWIGGILLIAFGFMILLKKIKLKEVDDNKKTVHAKFVLKGFLLNTFNPAVPIFWLSVISIVKLKEDYSKLHEAAFYISLLSTVFALDIAKTFVAHRIKALLKPNVLHWINRILGIILMGIGAYMIVKIYLKQS